MAKTKPVINVAFVGHVDHGKSTTIGHLMFKAGNLQQQQLDKLKAKLKSMESQGLNLHITWINLRKKEKEGLQ